MRKLLIGIPLLAAAAWTLAPAVRGEAGGQRAPKVRTRIAEPDATPADPAPTARPETPKAEPAAVVPAPSVSTRLGKAAAWPATLEFARMLAEDPEERARLIDELVRRRAGADPDARRRAEILLAELEMGWEVAAFAHPDPEVRKALLAQPPEATEAVVDRLIGAAMCGNEAAVREAALRGLPAGLGAEASARVAACLGDADPSVARAAIVVLRSAKAFDPATLAALRDVALGSGGDPETRWTARRALLKFSKDLSAADQAALERGLSGG